MCEFCRELEKLVELEKLGLKISVVSPDEDHQPEPTAPTTIEMRDPDGNKVELDPNNIKEMLAFAWDFIKKLSPEAAILIEKLSESLGTDVLLTEMMKPEYLTTQDVIGALILAKTITHVIPTRGVTMQMFSLSANLTALPQMNGIKPPPMPLPEGHFSSVQLIDQVPKAN